MARCTSLNDCVGGYFNTLTGECYPLVDNVWRFCKGTIQEHDQFFMRNEKQAAGNLVTTSFKFVK